jgi:hypothetical protein
LRLGKEEVKKKKVILKKYLEANPMEQDKTIAERLIKDYPELFSGSVDANRKTVNNARHEFNIDVPETVVIEDKIKIDSEIKEEKSLLKQTKAKADFLAEENSKLKKLLTLDEAFSEHNFKEYSFKSSPGKKSEATAIALLSDIHAEERVDKQTVNGLNEFNPDICKKRVINYFVNLRKLIDKERQDVEISKLVLALLGDNIHGFIHTEYMQTNYLTPQEASLFVYEILQNGINYLLEDEKLKEIIVVCKVGNHSRTTLKPYTNEEGKMSYEWGVYKHLNLRYENESRIKFIIDDSYFTYLNIYEKKIRFHHGHNVKYNGGIGGLTIPLIKYIFRINQQINADLDCIGHFHTRFSLPNVLINGSVVGFDSYALKIGARPENPMQTFQLIDSKRGFTVNTPILVNE